MSERRACKTLGQLRSPQRYEPKENQFQDKLEDRVIELATQYGRYGYRQVTNLLRQEGWDVGRDRVYSIWRKEGLQVPQKQPKIGRLWFADGSCLRLRPESRNHVLSYNFVSDRSHDGRPFKILNVVEEFSRECLASVVVRRIRSQEVILILTELMLQHGCPDHVRSDSGLIMNFVGGSKTPGWSRPVANPGLSKRRCRFHSYPSLRSSPLPKTSPARRDNVSLPPVPRESR